jgi:hypothetical protein
MSKGLSFVPLIIVLLVVLFVSYFFWGEAAGPEITQTVSLTEQTSPPLVAVEPSATDTSTPTPTQTPTPTNTTTPTKVISTSTPTDTPLPTYTPTPTSSPTNSPPPTDTPTVTATPAPTETPIPTPTYAPTPIAADAVVAASSNVVLLRSGPGPDYESLATLSAGTALDVLRWVHHKEEWIKVAVNPDSGERIEGYVNIASGYLEINVDLKDLPPIYEFGPAPFEPKRFETRAIGDFITFKWQDYGVLEEHQYYSLILVRDDLEDEDACYHWQTKETEVVIRPEDYECGGGAYHWGVGIATDLTQGIGNEREWRDDSERDERSPLGLGIPHPDAPADGSGGDGGEGGSSGSGRTGELPGP